MSGADKSTRKETTKETKEDGTPTRRVTDKGESSNPTPVLEKWNVQEVEAWFTKEFNQYAEKFKGVRGADIAGLTEAQLQGVLGPLHGSILFNALNPLKEKQALIQNQNNSSSSSNVNPALPQNQSAGPPIAAVQFNTPGPTEQLRQSLSLLFPSLSTSSPSSLYQQTTTILQVHTMHSKME